MQIDVREATAEHRPILANLLQFYLYDFTEFMGWDIPDTGRFKEDDLAGCWTEPWRHPFLIRVDGKLAGFAIVDSRSALTGDTDTRDIAEFFIVRRYRRRGVGASVATWLLDHFPGKWEIRQLAQNTAATTFWRKLIDRYTGGRFEEVFWDDARWQGPVQFFDSRIQAQEVGSQ